MTSGIELSRSFLDFSHQMVSNNVKNASLEEMLFVPEGGYRSMLGTLKHIAGWSRVYYSYAFEEQPRHWEYSDWPRGLRDTIDASPEYIDEMIAWFDQTHERWMQSLAELNDDDLDAPHLLHWREPAPLSRILTIISTHHVYHAGELNQVLSIKRGEAWEDGEEVEENHVSTVGHRVPPPWKN
jgi:uncharacterized damage-inducible protein DinB